MWIKICSYILLALISLVITVPVNEREFKCSQTCKRIAKLMSYEIGETYVYDYESITAINLAESGNMFAYSPIQIKAVVEISVHSLCELSLQLSDVQLQFNSTLNNDILIERLQANSLNFGYDDGKVVAVCPSKHEHIWVLNVKKSILSALQISTNTIESETTVTETDISGECQTVYKPKTNNLDDSIEIEKVKSLQKCIQNANSMSGVNILNALIIRHLDFSESSMKCLQVVKQKIINSVKCDEVQAFQSPALTTTDLITNLSLSFKYREMNTALERRTRNVISDDLSLTTKDSTNFNKHTTNAYNYDHKNRVQTLYKMSTINFFVKPTKNEVKFLIPLLHSSKTTNQEILLISSVLAKYCEHRDNCDQIDMIAATIDQLLNKIHTSKSNEKIYIMKAIANINITTHQTAKAILINLAENQLNSDEVRVESMNTLRNCMTHTISEMLMRIYRDRSESVEMRISAYKLIVTSRFASDKNWHEFSSETDQNVANYMRTHVKNLRKMSDNNNILPENMPDFAEPDSNTFIASSNYDFNYSGVAINLDTIFANSSIIPKKVIIKTSLPLFGKRLQLIEITVRQKGFDNYLKHILSETSDRLPLIYKELIELFANNNLNSDMKNNYLQIMIKLDGKNIFIFDSKNIDVNSHSIESFIKKSLKILVESLSSNKELVLNNIKHKIQIPTIAGIALNIDMNGSLKASVAEKNRRNTRIFKTELKVETYLEKGVYHKSGLESKFDSEISFDLTNIELSFKRVVQNIQSLTSSDANAKINHFEIETSNFCSKIQITSPNMNELFTELKLQTPWKNISIAASMDNLKAIRFDIKDNGIKEISFGLSVNSDQHSGRYIRSVHKEISNEIVPNKNDVSISVQLKVYNFETDIGVWFDQTNKNAALNVDYKIDDNSDKENIKFFSGYKRYEILNKNYHSLALELDSTQFGINYRLHNNISINSYELIFDNLADITHSFRVWLFADINNGKPLPNYLNAKFSGALFENSPHFKRFSDIRIILTADQNNITARIITPFRIVRGILTVSPDSSIGSDECFSEIREVMFKLDDISSDSSNERLLSTVVHLSTDRLFFDINSNYKWKESVENIKLGYKLCSKISFPSIKIMANTSLQSTQFSSMNAILLYALSGDIQNDVYNEILIAWKNGFNNKIHMLRTLERNQLFDNFYMKENVTFIATPFDLHSEVIEIVRNEILDDVRNVVISVTKSDKTGRHSQQDYTISFAARIDYDNYEEIGGSINATLKYWGRDMEYRENWQLFGDNGKDGDIYFQWQTERYANIAYTIDIKNLLNEKKMDVKLKYMKWDETETNNILGTISHKKSYDTDRTRINFESDSGQIFKGIVTIDGSALSRLLNIYNVTYDLSYSSINDISVKITGKRSQQFGEGSNHLEIDYKLPNSSNELIKYSSQASIDKVRVSKYLMERTNHDQSNRYNHFHNHYFKFDTQVNVSIDTDFIATQWPKYNHNIYYNLVYLSDDRLVNQKLRLNWSSDNTLVLKHEKNKTIIDNNEQLDHTIITVKANPYDFQYKIENKVSVKQPQDGYVIYKRDLIAKHLNTGYKSQLSFHGNLNNGNVSGYYFVELNCSKTNSSHKTNISVDYDYLNDYLNHFSVDSITVNANTKKTTIVKLVASEHTLNLLLLFPTFDLILSETDGNTTIKESLVFIGKNNLLPYKHITELKLNKELDTITANSKTYEIVTEENSNDISAGNDLKLMAESNIEYEFDKRGVLEFVAFDQYKHRTEISFENWPAIQLNSSMHKMSDNIYNVRSSLSDDFILDLNVSMPSTKLEFELNPNQQTAKLFINDP